MLSKFENVQLDILRIMLQSRQVQSARRMSRSRTRVLPLPRFQGWVEGPDPQC